ncbi:hypothetical protein NESM_000149300 [Novymonas esmeraldas]|uniref:Uncharacterized protein n=1 Tax=Novymonas esmeraldas TaxID=1808958 RepID=A0AAW0F402_9TRYP
MALEAPRALRLSDADQLLAWEAEVEARWSQLQQRRRSAEALSAKQLLLEASLLELRNENTATQYVLEERRRALATRRTQLREAGTASRQRALEGARASRRQRESVAEDGAAIAVAWGELEQRTRLEDASHAQRMEALEAGKRSAQARIADARQRQDALHHEEAQLMARHEALRHQQQTSTELLRQTLAQLQREMERRQALLATLEERTGE